MAVSGERFLADLYMLRSFGAAGTGNGVVRPAFSPADVAAREWLAGRMSDAGLEPRFDSVGNLFGLAGNLSILIGSHSDTQPEGGWLDGAFGVIAALEVARTMQETGGPPVSVVSFQDEEGRFGATVGSGIWTGAVPLVQADQAVDEAGVTLREARQSMAHLVGTRVSPGRFKAFIEPHIEQGPWLDDAGQTIGVVSAIVGLREIEVTLTGQQNHAGTTSMDARRDAVQGMVAVSAALNERLAAIATDRTVWTVGRVDVSPNAGSIVPGRCVFSVQWRDAEKDRLDAMQTMIHEVLDSIAAERGLELTVTQQPDLAPVEMNANLRSLLETAAEKIAPGKWQSMPSGAVHDAGYVARVLPTAMMFVPSIGGISHDFAEDTNEEDLVTGVKVLAEAVEQF